ncbi:MAG: hypothetical protein SAqTSA_33400 [Shewanella algae]
MTDLHLLLTLGTIHLLALASPGPDFALILKIASREQRSTALAAAVGISLAILVHTVLSLTGVSLAIQSSHTLFVLVQLFGAFIWAGWDWGLLVFRPGLNAPWRQGHSLKLKPMNCQPAGQQSMIHKSCSPRS